MASEVNQAHQAMQHLSAPQQPVFLNTTNEHKGSFFLALH
jgi:hypothetical protein